MYLLVLKFRLLEFRLLLSRVASYLQFITTNCLIGIYNYVSAKKKKKPLKFRRPFWTRGPTYLGNHMQQVARCEKCAAHMVFWDVYQVAKLGNPLILTKIQFK